MKKQLTRPASMQYSTFTAHRATMRYADAYRIPSKERVKHFKDGGKDADFDDGDGGFPVCTILFIGFVLAVIF